MHLHDVYLVSSYGRGDPVGCPWLHVSRGQYDRSISGSTFEISHELSRLEIHHYGFCDRKSWGERQSVSENRDLLLHTLEVLNVNDSLRDKYCPFCFSDSRCTIRAKKESSSTMVPSF